MNRKFKGVIFGVDFDGTCVLHNFPELGADAPGAVDTLRYILAQGGRLVLNTMRSNMPERNYLDEAVMWFKRHGLELFGINVNPLQKSWTTSPKVYAHYYIDDAALGTPLVFDKGLSDRFYVDWKNMRRILDALIPEREAIHGVPPQIVTE